LKSYLKREQTTATQLLHRKRRIEIMGIYINPPDRTKESWLEEHAIQRMSAPTEYKYSDDTALISLVFNPSFTAAAVVCNQQEFDEFSDSRDRRVKLWCAVSRTDVLAVCPDLSPDHFKPFTTEYAGENTMMRFNRAAGNLLGVLQVLTEDDPSIQPDIRTYLRMAIVDFERTAYDLPCVTTQEYRKVTEVQEA